MTNVTTGRNASATALAFEGAERLVSGEGNALKGAIQIGEAILQLVQDGQPKEQALKTVAKAVGRFKLSRSRLQQFRLLAEHASNPEVSGAHSILAALKAAKKLEPKKPKPVTAKASDRIITQAERAVADLRKLVEQDPTVLRGLTSTLQLLAEDLAAMTGPKPEPKRSKPKVSDRSFGGFSMVMQEVQ
jgi:hypothetical protein